jgi:hypothetical protein
VPVGSRGCPADPRIGCGRQGVRGSPGRLRGGSEKASSHFATLSADYCELDPGGSRVRTSGRYPVISANTPRDAPGRPPAEGERAPDARPCN